MTQTNLTPHFTLEELTATSHREFDNTPDEAAKANLIRLAKFLEEVKETLGGKPVMVTSGYRSEAVNRSVGSKNTSAHRLGLAADLKIPGMTPDEVVTAIRVSELEFDQLIREFDSWAHVAIAPEGKAGRRQVLIIDKAGTRPYQ